MPETFRINDGVRRAKAAQLAGHEAIWARVGPQHAEQRIPIRSLLSPKSNIDVSRKGELQRWESVKAGMAEEPDLFPPIDVIASSEGVPITEVRILGEAGKC